jgi:crotonobetainyl-CoA:carnitine CoA-transferase CaiB-like acyl-CoA transferase
MEPDRAGRQHHTPAAIGKSLSATVRPSAGSWSPGHVSDPLNAPWTGDGPLTGLHVADFSRILAGPLATMVLGDLGADVIKVERPGIGDDTRSWSPPTGPDGESTYFLAVNRNKRSITIDLSTSDGQAAARELAVRADVVVENFAPGTMERFGLGYDDLAGDNPGLIYASITGFGRGAGAWLPGYDFLVQAVGGLMSVTGDPDGEPTKVGVALVDVLAGQNLVSGILAALYHRERTGAGQRVDVDLLSSLLFGLVNQASSYLNAGVVPQRLGNAHPSIAPYQTLRTADRTIAVAVGNDGQFHRLAELVDIEVGRGSHLAQEERFATNQSRVRHIGPLMAALERRLRTRPAAYWVAKLTAVGVPCGVVNTVAEGFALAGSLGLDPVVRITRDDQFGADDFGTGDVGTSTETRSVANPIRLSRTPVSYRRPPPQAPDA